MENKEEDCTDYSTKSQSRSMVGSLLGFLLTGTSNSSSLLSECHEVSKPTREHTREQPRLSKKVELIQDTGLMNMLNSAERMKNLLSSPNLLMKML